MINRSMLPTGMQTPGHWTQRLIMLKVDSGGAELTTNPSEESP